MTTQDDQPRPDLDAAIDAVLPSLTAVSDDAAAESLRRTRLALADTAPRRASVGAWTWVAPAMVAAVLVVGVALWWTRVPTDDPPRVTRVEPAAPAATTPSTAPTARTPAPAPLPGRSVASGVPSAPPVVAAVRPRRSPPLRATSIGTPRVVARGPDPLIALTAAVQAIPEEAWSAMARAAAPLTTPAFETEPIDVPPVVTPPIADAPLAPLAEGDR